MIFSKKTIRYYWWFILEFYKKHIKIIIITFLISFISAISLVSISPVIENIIFYKKEIIGLVGDYNLNNLPEEIETKISNGLIYLRDDGLILPALAQSWEIKENGKEFIIHLKNNLSWNNGKPFRAADINYSFKDVKMKVLSDNTVIFSLEKPLPIFITYLNKPIIKPPLIGVGGLYKTNRIIMKQGKLNSIILSPNKKNYPIVIYKFFNNEENLILAYKKGEITKFQTNKISIRDQLKKWRNTKIERSTDYSKLLTLYYNFNNPLLKEKDFRDALEISVNKEIFSEFGEIAISPISPLSWAYSRTLKPKPYDPDSAKKIIDRLQTATQSAHFQLYTSYDYATYADKIIESMAKVNLAIDINYITSNIPKKFDLLLIFLKIPNDPDQYYYWHSTQINTNIGSYINLKIDKLLEDGRNTYLLNERKKIYTDYQRIIIDDPPALFLIYPYIYTIQRK